MKIYEYIPTKNLSRLSGLIIISLSLAAALFAMPLLVPTIPFQWVFQLLSVVFLVVALYLYTRYVAKNFAFSIIADEDGDGECDLTVCELSNGNRRRITVCRIGISSIYESHLLHPEIAEESNKQKELLARARAEHLKLYDYCHDINPSPILILLVEECGEKILIKLSPDEMLLKYLKAE